MTYRLFIDDERFPMTPDWFVARNSYQAIKALELYGVPREIAFDHDLGGQDTAINFINHLENKLIDNDLKLPKGFKYTVHSQNPIGAMNIASKMDGLIDYFGFKE
jgi:hypothetical protein|nr:MAG TPA: hypothetical protein [Caudoviricetes sp.]